MAPTGTDERTLTSTGIRLTITSMLTDEKLLNLAQLLSPAFPTGAFAYSHGLETAFREAWIADAASLEDWLRDCLIEGTGRSDAIWVRSAFVAEDPIELDRTARAFVLGRERLRETERQGAAFTRTANAVWLLDLPDLILPVAVGRVARLCDIDLDATVSLYLQAFASNLVAAAMRLSPIGQTAGQKVIHRLNETCLAVSKATRGLTEDDVFSNAFLSDIAAMQHETLEPRLFQS